MYQVLAGSLHNCGVRKLLFYMSELSFHMSGAISWVISLADTPFFYSFTHTTTRENSAPLGSTYSLESDWKNKVLET